MQREIVAEIAMQLSLILDKKQLDDCSLHLVPNLHQCNSAISDPDRFIEQSKVQGPSQIQGNM